MHGMRTAHASPVCLRVIDYLQVEILGHNPSKATVAVRSRTLRAQDEGLIHRFQNKQALPREERNFVETQHTSGVSEQMAHNSSLLSPLSISVFSSCAVCRYTCQVSMQVQHMYIHLLRKFLETYG